MNPSLDDYNRRTLLRPVLTMAANAKDMARRASDSSLRLGRTLMRGVSQSPHAARRRARASVGYDVLAW